MTKLVAFILPFDNFITLNGDTQPDPSEARRYHFGYQYEPERAS
jgi:hypothetical protein